MNRETTTVKAGGHTFPWWLIFTFDNPLRKPVHDPEKLLEPYVQSGDTVLDVGCGMGFFSLGLARLVGEEGGQDGGHHGKVIAADLQEQMLAGLCCYVNNLVEGLPCILYRTRRRADQGGD